MNRPEHRTGTVSSGDVKLFYRAFGEPGQTPVLIVHGLSYFSYDWIDVAAALATDRQVVAMDMRGFGDSTWSPAKNYGLADFSADIGAMLDHQRWKRAVVIGHSMGGRNTTYFAWQHPERVERLILIDYSPTNAPAGSKRVTDTVAGVPDLFTTVDAALEYFGQSPAALPAGHPVRARYEAYLKSVPGGFVIKRDPVFRDRFRKIRDTGERPKLPVDMWQALASVACPVLVIRGIRSDMFAPETVARVKDTSAHLELVEADAGHDIAGDNPQALLAEVQRFLRKRS